MRSFTALLTLVILLSLGARFPEARADGDQCGGAPLRAGDLIPGLKAFDSPFPGVAMQADRLFERAEDCARRNAKDAPRGLETLEMTKARVVGTDLEPFADEIHSALTGGRTETAAYASLARILGSARLMSAYERFTGKTMASLPPSCQGKLDRAFAKPKPAGPLPGHDPAFAEEFRGAAQRLGALMAEQAFFHEWVQKRKAGKAGRDAECDRFLKGTLGQPYCPEDRLHELERSIEAHYSAFPQLAMGRDPSRPAHEEGARVAKIVSMSPAELSDHIRYANLAVAEKLDAAMGQLCSEGGAAGVPARDLLRMPSLRDDAIWKERFPEFNRVRSCLASELKGESELLKDNRRGLAWACAFADFAAAGLVSPVCAGVEARERIGANARKLTWLSRCRGGGNAVCEGSEAIAAQHEHESAHEAWQDAKLRGATAVAGLAIGGAVSRVGGAATGVAADSAAGAEARALRGGTEAAIEAGAARVATAGAREAVAVPEALATRLSAAARQPGVARRADLLERLEAMQGKLSQRAIDAIEEAHRFGQAITPDMPLAERLRILAGKARILREKAPELTQLDREALLRGGVCGEGRVTETVTETTVWGKIDCDGCGIKAQSARPDSSGQAKCTNCGKVLDTSKAYLGQEVDGTTGRLVNPGETVVKGADEIAMAKGGPDWSCKHCATPNKQVKAECGNCGAPKVTPVPVVARPRVPAPPAPAKSKAPVLAGVAAVGAAAVGGKVAYDHFLKEHDVQGKVTRSHWSRTFLIQDFVPAVKRDWRDVIPSGPSVQPRDGEGERIGSANVRECRKEQRGVREYVCGKIPKTRQVPFEVQDEPDCRMVDDESPYGKDCKLVPTTVYDTVPDGQSCSEKCAPRNNGNGSFTNVCKKTCVEKTKQVPRKATKRQCKKCDPRSHTEYRTEHYEVDRICQDPIMADRCTFDTYEWRDSAPIERQGDLRSAGARVPAPSRSDLRLKGSQRISSVKEEFAVGIEFTAPDGKRIQHQLKPASASELERWREGANATVKSSRHGNVQSLQPGR